MDMNPVSQYRILITGASGTGTSSLGKLVGEFYQIPWMDLDDLYWEPSDPKYTIKRSIAEREKLLEAATTIPNWVLSGSLLNWGQFLVHQINLVVFLTVPTPERIKKIREREIYTFGKDAISRGGDREKIFNDFLLWAESYDVSDKPGRSKKLHEEWLSTLKCQKIRIDGNQDNQTRLNAIIEILKTL